MLSAYPAFESVYRDRSPTCVSPPGVRYTPMTAKRPHWEMAGESLRPAAAHHPILPPLASVCGDVFSRMLPMHGAPTLQRPTSGDSFLQPRASWPQLPIPSSEPLRQSASSTGIVPRVIVTSAETKRPQHPAGPGFSRQLPLSPSRQDSQSSDASQETPVPDEVRLIHLRVLVAS